MSPLLRGLPFLLAALLIAWLFLGERPREVLLVYDLPDDPAPERVEVRLVDEAGRVPALIHWGGGGGLAADRQRHRARLAPGRYRLEATLRFGDGASREIARPLEIGPHDEEIVLHLGQVR